MPDQTPPQASPPRALRWAVAGSAIVMIAAGGLFYYAAQLATAKRERQANHDQVLVTIAGHSCEPNALTVPAGRASFRIVNRSDRAVEWEILDGVLVVEERENIAPGLSQVINANLLPGDYTITCGLLSNPRGTLHVTPTAASQAAAKAGPALLAFVGPLSEYRVFLSRQGSALIKAVTALEQAIAAADLGQAQALYLPARAAYQRLAPAAQRLGQLNNAINARADYFEKREQDPGFVGFHRLEYALFEQRNLDRLAPLAQRLLTDVTSLKQQLLAQSLAPEQLVSIVVRNLDNIAQVRAHSGEEERYSHSDLNGFAGNLDASRKVVELLRPLLGKSDAPLLTNIDTALADFAAELDGFKVDGGYASYDSVSPAQRQQIADKAKALAAALDAIDPALGLSGL
ncbi:iron uptake system protein EfeO [Pseudomonas putida]|uniref:iron uptake system protein EfeO n=1 Tax=Pseudomonas putida TaxID=303 RepID=UPI000981EBB2|nr:iron uptake system protein EfeO [Pseudomonas putida]OMQ39506.1 multidrug DMT transporter permease [Pseudomonas putida]